MDRRRQKVPGTPSAQLAATGSSSDQSREKISGTAPAPSVQFAVAGSSAGQPQSARGPMYNHPPDDPDDIDQQHDSDARNTTYPTELYTLDEFLAEEDMLDSFAEDIPVFAQVLQRDARIRDRGTHRALKTDLVEHIWKKFGPK
ncbi:uncharacterized protein [Triticum aestivum]|uniref:uncharacterized protein n=1 Tax=Triticum aestivum TaxID=4565 RepID=UPI001D01277F|nr:uncharacterized protein LOC123113232 [Triticum aestivum]